MVYLLERCYHWVHVLTLEPNEGTFVAHLVAIVGCREYSKAFSTLLVLVALGLDFVGANDQLWLKRKG